MPARGICNPQQAELHCSTAGFRLNRNGTCGAYTIEFGWNSFGVQNAGTGLPLGSSFLETQGWMR